MVSGKYSALSGAVAKDQAMGNVASNLANANTAGFKKDRISFAAILRGTSQMNDAQGVNYARIRKIGTDFSQGGMQPTGRQLDVAIDGEGFLKVQRNNETFYTRSGHLMLDETGMVKTQDGLNVLDTTGQPLQFDTSAGNDIAIADNGTISINGKSFSGKIQVFTVEEKSKMTKAGNSLYKLEEGTDQPLDTSRVLQGNLETSNVNMMDEMAAMIAIQRTFEVQSKVMESYSTLASKQDELGSIG